MKIKNESKTRKYENGKTKQTHPCQIICNIHLHNTDDCRQTMCKEFRDTQVNMCHAYR